MRPSAHSMHILLIPYNLAPKRNVASCWLPTRFCYNMYLSLLRVSSLPPRFNAPIATPLTASFCLVSVNRCCGDVPIGAPVGCTLPAILANAVLRGCCGGAGGARAPSCQVLLCSVDSVSFGYVFICRCWCVFSLLHGRIRASIAQFQQELIGHVKEAVSAIQDKFRHRYEVRWFSG